jgi:hypothetical protein
VPNGQAGQPCLLDLNFYNENSGVLTDPASVQLDITYGEEIGFVPDVPGGGPFTYAGASASAVNTIWRIGAGQYACLWAIPPAAPQGVYVANWTCGFQGDTFLGTENFPVTGGFPPSVPSGDLGYWTGSLVYTPSAGTPAQPVTINFGQVDANGIAWLWQKIDGWDSPDVQGSGVIPRSGDHGAWPSPQYYAARTMTLTVMASAPTQALRDLARTILQAAVPISDLAVLTYDEPIPKQAAVRRSGKVTETYPTLADVAFTAGLVAPDPRKYGTVQKTLTLGLTPPPDGGGMVVPFTVPFTLDPGLPPGASVLFNAGNFETRPVVIIGGPVQAPLLANLTLGQTVTWSTLTLNSGDLLVVDFLNRQAVLNPTAISNMPGIPSAGGAYIPADITSAWWEIAPGASTVEYGGIAGTGSSATFYWLDSFT